MRRALAAPLTRVWLVRSAAAPAPGRPLATMRETTERTFGRFVSRARELLTTGRAALLERLSEGLSIEEKELLIGTRTKGSIEEKDVEALVEEQSIEVAALHKARMNPTSDSDQDGVLEAAEPDPHTAAPRNAAFELREWDPSSGEIRDIEDPILGRYLCTFDSKKVYAADVPTLARIPVWEKQRVYRKERARKIADDRKKRRRKAGAKLAAFPGIITVYEKAWVPQERPISEILDDPNELTKARQRYGIVDGQHRVGAMRILHQQGEFSERVLLEVYPIEDERGVSELFTDINKSEPVKDVDLPDASISKREKEMLFSAITALQQIFPRFFSPSVKCKVPNVNADNLRDAIYQVGLLHKADLATDEELLSFLMEQNERLSAVTREEWLARGDGALYTKAVEKALEGNFFLGLDRSWLEDFGVQGDLVGESEEDAEASEGGVGK